MSVLALAKELSEQGAQGIGWGLRFWGVWFVGVVESEADFKGGEGVDGVA